MGTPWTSRAINLSPAHLARLTFVLFARPPVTLAEVAALTAAQLPNTPKTPQELQRFLLGTAWLNTNGFTFEWDSTGQLWHIKDKIRERKQHQFVAHDKFIIYWDHGPAPHIVTFSPHMKGYHQQCTENPSTTTSAIRIR